MPRRPIERTIQDRIYVLGIESTRPSPTAIAAQLEKEFGVDAPAPRTVKRYLDALKLLPDDAKRDYRLVHWPESFERGDLPWAAVVVLFDLLRWNHRLSPPWPEPSWPSDSPGWLAEEQAQISREEELMRSGIANRPTTRLVKWLHRITEAYPEAPFDWLLEMASHLAAGEGVGGIHQLEMNRAVETRITVRSLASIIVRVAGGTEGDNDG